MRDSRPARCAGSSGPNPPRPGRLRICSRPASPALPPRARRPQWPRFSNRYARLDTTPGARADSSHIGIVRAAAALGHHPIDVLRGILDVAGLAVDAVRRVDLQPRGTGRIPHDLIDLSLIHISEPTRQAEISYA